ncbi:MAG: aspartate carbamoyltransferase [Armatimonadota bacterium]|nr:MAG: aspartate carbamoyltransferase [Armatimonadota bacterium]
MALVGRDLVSVFDLANAEIEAIFALADDMGQYVRAKTDIARGKLMATLFYEPSTRTRLSFEAAMLRLGGDVISCAEVASTSVAKGETIADTVRIIESYADVIVMRHPLEGSARVAADYAAAPVINAGDGAHEHPTQTLLDLYTIRKEKGRIEGVWVALVGDLKHARTAHSLAYGLARFGARIACVAPQGLELPREISDRMRERYNAPTHEYGSLDELVADPDLVRSRKASDPDEQLALTSNAISLFDALYVTRVQRERFATPEEFAAASSSYSITADMLSRARPDALVMHPLPRVDELDYDIDADPRAAYFRQAAYGVPVRMALVAAMLGLADLKIPAADEPERRAPRKTPAPGIKCSNPRCVTTEERHLQPLFEPVGATGRKLRCAYCERITKVPQGESA